MAKSIQGRFDDNNLFSSAGSFWEKTLKFAPVPAWGQNVATRDKFLNDFWALEPMLSGVVNTVVQRDQSRSWHLVGTDRQVQFYSKVLMDADTTADSYNGGWFDYIGKQALSYYTTDLGFITELGRERKRAGNRIVALWHLDPLRSRKYSNGNVLFNANTTGVELENWEVLSGAALPSIQYGLAGLGRCAVGRVIDAVKIMLGVMNYESAALMASQPKGVITLEGMSLQEWEDAVYSRKMSIENGSLPTDSPLVLAALDKLRFDFTTLNKLPDAFDRATFIEWLVQIYATAFGYNVDEFYSITSSAFSRSGEVDISTRRSSSKGDKAFSLMYAEKLQRWLPQGLNFGFDSTSDFGDDLQAQADERNARAIKLLYEAGMKFGEGVITRDEARAILKAKGILPEDVDLVEDSVIMTRKKRDYLMGIPQVRSAVHQLDAQGRNDPISRYQWTPFGQKHQVLVADGRDLLNRTTFPVAKREVKFDGIKVTVTDDLLDDLKIKNKFLKDLFNATESN